MFHELAENLGGVVMELRCEVHSSSLQVIASHQEIRQKLSFLD